MPSVTPPTPPEGAEGASTDETAPPYLLPLPRVCQPCHGGRHTRCEVTHYASPFAPRVPCECEVCALARRALDRIANAEASRRAMLARKERQSAQAARLIEAARTAGRDAHGRYTSGEEAGA